MVAIGIPACHGRESTAGVAPLAQALKPRAHPLPPPRSALGRAPRRLGRTNGLHAVSGSRSCHPAMPRQGKGYSCSACPYTLWVFYRYRVGECGPKSSQIAQVFRAQCILPCKSNTRPTADGYPDATSTDGISPMLVQLIMCREPPNAHRSRPGAASSRRDELILRRRRTSDGLTSVRV